MTAKLPRKRPPGSHPEEVARAGAEHSQEQCGGRGLTLVEVLVSLSLLSSLMLVASWWVVEFARNAFPLEERLRWESCAREVLCRIAEDAQIGDLAPSETSKVEIEDGHLRIWTRVAGADGGAVLHDYHSTGDKLLLSVTAVLAPVSEGVLLERVTHWSAAFVSDKRLVLRVELRSDGRAVGRSIRLQ